jgi:ParB family chromosome partitioning protein
MAQSNNNGNGLSNMSLKLKNYAAIFGEDTEKSEKTDITMLPISVIKPFPNHPFKLYSGKKLDDLIESIRKLGILNPVLVRKYGDNYQNLSGHNRVNAAGIIGLKEVPCIIKEVDFDTAVQIVVDSNLRQRNSLLPSEKAFAFKMKLEALNRQGKRENNSEKLKKSRDLVGEDFGDSGTQVQRYIRLTYLLPTFLNKVDENEMPLNTAVELSYLLAEEQELLLQVVSEESLKIKLSQAVELKTRSRVSKLTVTDITGIFKQGANSDRGTFIKLPKSKFLKYFKDDDKEDQVMKVIIEALDKYFNHL